MSFSYDRILGWSAFAGVGVVLVAYFFNYFLAKWDIYVSIVSELNCTC